MPRIGDDIYPSHVKTAPRERLHDGNLFSDVALRYGEVQKIITPDSPQSRSKKFIEYDVYVQYRAANKSAQGRMYQNCLLINPMGGLADAAFFTLRAEDSANTKQNLLGLGSKVLMLCINGDHTQAVIIGGMRDPEDKREEKSKAKDLGHHLYFNFNGISFFINKDGELLVEYGGKTKNDGTTDVDKKQTGTRMAFLQDGSWNINTRDPDDPDNNQEQFIFLDHKNHTTTHQAKKQWQCQVKGKAKFTADDGVHLNQATDFMLLGTSHRNAQKQMHQKMKTFYQTLSTVLQNAGIQLNAASIANAVPMTGGIAAAPSFAAAAVLLITASQFVNQIGQAINSFESSASSSNDFLSQKHKLD